MAGDASYPSVSLLLHCDGADGSSTLTDNGPDARSPTSLGTALISTDQSKFGGASVEFIGSGAQIQYANNADFNFGAGAFTIEFFVRLTAVAAVQVLCTNYGSASTGWVIASAASGGISINLSGDGVDISAAGVFAANTWAHVALSGSSGSIKAFVDGTQVGSTFTGAVSLDTSAPLTIGGLLVSATWYDRLTGFIDDLRITKGVARYTSAFTPPTIAHYDGMGQVSGVIRDDAGAVCARTVRLVNRSTGALIGSTTSDAGTGAYLLATPTLDEVQRIVLDDSGGTLYNDIIDRVIPA